MTKPEEAVWLRQAADQIERYGVDFFAIELGPDLAFSMLALAEEIELAGSALGLRGAYLIAMAKRIVDGLNLTQTSPIE